MRPIALPVAAALLAGTALAAGAADDVPTAAEIQNNEQLDTGMEVPEIAPGTQAVDVNPDPSEAARTDGPNAPSGAAPTEADRTVDEIVEGAERDPATGQVEAATGGAVPVENWFGCKPDEAGQAAHCDEETAREPGDVALPAADAGSDPEAVTGAGPGSDVRPPEPGNDAVDNLTTGEVAPGANPEAEGADAGRETLGQPRTRTLETEPQKALGKERRIDLEKDARVVPETDTAADLGERAD